MGFRDSDLGGFPNKFRLITQPVGVQTQPVPRTCVVMPDGAQQFYFWSSRRCRVGLSSPLDEPGGSDGLDEPAPALRSEGLLVLLESVRRRLFSMRASRAFTSSNSEVVTMYWSRAGRILAISSCEWRMRSGVCGWLEKTLATTPGLRFSSA